MLLPILVALSIPGVLVSLGHGTARIVGLATHAPILIVGDSNFTGANGVVGGTGTLGDPFVIEGWQIDSATANAIEIRDTRSSFIIRNVTAFNSNMGPPFHFATSLANTTNARVEFVTVGDQMLGFSLAASDRVLLTSLNQTSGQGPDLSVSASSNITVTKSRFNGRGIVIYDTPNVTISANHMVSAYGDVVIVDGTRIDIDSNVFDRGVIVLNTTRDSTVSRNRIGLGWILIGFGPSHNTTIIANEVHAVAYGIDAISTENATIRGNNVTSATEFAVALGGANVTFVGNRVSDSATGIFVRVRNGSIFHNDFMRNSQQARLDLSQGFAWDSGYPSGGNFWSDFAGVDNCSGPNQNVCPSPDGIGDTPYAIDANNTDRYPFMRFLGNDTTPPSVTITTPSTGAVFTTSPIAVTGTASDLGGSGLSSVQVRTNGGPWTNAVGTSSWHASLNVESGSNLVEAVASDGVGNLSPFANVSVTYNPPPPPPNTPPYANFSFSPASGNVSTVFRFNSTSWDSQDPPSALRVRWDWESDGTWDTPLSANATATHQFAAPGNYTVTMEVVDTGGLSSNRSALIPVTEVPPPPPPPLRVTITADPRSGTMPLTVSFTSTVTGGVAPYQFEWHLGDGATSPAANTVHIYLTGGNFPIWLNVDDSARAYAQSDVLFVNVTAAIVNLTVATPPQFSESSNGITVSFTSSVTGGRPPYTFHWEFGDGGQSVDANPSHTYASPGTYTVTVTVTDADGKAGTRTFSLLVPAHSTPPASESLWYPAALAASSGIAAMFAVLYFLQRRRGRLPPP